MLVRGPMPLNLNAGSHRFNPPARPTKQDNADDDLDSTRPKPGRVLGRFCQERLTSRQKATRRPGEAEGGGRRWPPKVVSSQAVTGVAV